MSHVQRDWFQKIFGHFDFRNESIGHINQSILGPGMEEINSSGSNKSRELTRLHSEIISNGREAKNHLEIYSHLVQEVLLHSIGSVRDSCSFGFISESRNHSINVFLGEEVLNPTIAQHIIHGHQETLVFDLRVGNHESNRSGSRFGDLLVKVLKISSQVVQSKVRCNGKLVNINSGNESCQFGKRLLTRSSHTDQQSVTNREI